jgi:hypothetical protein
VVITGYDEERLDFFHPCWLEANIFTYRLKLSEDAIKKDVPNANIHRLTLNLASFASVRKAAEAVPEPLHVRLTLLAPPSSPALK